MGLGAPELILVLLAVMVLFGYRKLPDASRSLGRSLRIFKGEMKGMKDDDVRTGAAAATSPAQSELVAPHLGTPEHPAERARSADPRR